MSDFLDAAKEAAMDAGRLLQGRVGDLAVEQKRTASGNSEEVTRLDRECETLIRQRLLDCFPDHGFIGEESTPHAPDSEFIWVVDPIDGTSNFIRGLPHYCVSVALVQSGKLALGVTYLPAMAELFFAESTGAFLNGRPIRVSEKAELDVLVMDFTQRRQQSYDRLMAWLPKLTDRYVNFRSFGASAVSLSYLAAGRVNCVVDPSLNCWDSTAGVHLAQQAGALVTQVDGSPYDPVVPKCSVLAANPALHAKLLPLLT